MGDAGCFAWFGLGEADGLRQNGVTDQALDKVIWPAPAGGLLTGLNGSASAWLEARQESEIVSHDRGPDIGLEVVEPAPGAARQAVCTLKA